MHIDIINLQIISILLKNGDSYDLTFIKIILQKRENDDFYSQWEDVASRYDPYNEYKNGDVVFTGKAKFYEKVCCFTQDTNDINVEHGIYYKLKTE